MNQGNTSALSATQYPDYVSTEPKNQNHAMKSVKEAFDWVSGYSGLLAQAWLAITLVTLAVHMVYAQLLHADTPGWVIGVMWVVIAPVAAVLLGLLAIGITVGPIVAISVFVMMLKNRNKTDLDIFEVNHIARSLASVGVSNARDIVLANPLQAEAYARVSGRVMKLAREQGMSVEESMHHGHWLGMLMYPGTSELERESPLMRVLEDHGVVDANTALATLEEPHYRVFTVPVTDEEISASKESVKSFDGDIMAVIDLEEKIRREGYKPTSEERKLIKGSQKRYGSFTAHAALGIFVFTTALGIVGTIGMVLTAVNNGMIDGTAAVLWSLAGAYFSAGLGSVMTALAGESL